MMPYRLPPIRHSNSLGKVMFISSLAVDRTFGEWLRVNIKFAQAVDYNMGVNVACNDVFSKCWIVESNPVGA